MSVLVSWSGVRRAVMDAATVSPEHKIELPATITSRKNPREYSTGDGYYPINTHNVKSISVYFPVKNWALSGTGHTTCGPDFINTYYCGVGGYPTSYFAYLPHRLTVDSSGAPSGGTVNFYSINEGAIFNLTCGPDRIVPSGTWNGEVYRDFTSSPGTTVGGNIGYSGSPLAGGHPELSFFRIVVVNNDDSQTITYLPEATFSTITVPDFSTYSSGTKYIIDIRLVSMSRAVIKISVL